MHVSYFIWVNLPHSSLFVKRRVEKNLQLLEKEYSVYEDCYSKAPAATTEAYIDERGGKMLSKYKIEIAADFPL